MVVPDARQGSPYPGPLVIGGLGGSGTRLAAHLVRELGFYLGDELNFALDNLWFACLFRRPEWYRAKPEQVPIALRLFEKAMHGNPSFEPVEAAVLREAVRKQGCGALKLAQSMRNSRGLPANASGWGWKNPSTHIFIEQLADAFPSMKFIHVIRNGLELANKAKSANQVHLWGSLFGIDPPKTPGVPSPRAALSYWVRANQRVMNLGPQLFGDRFLLLRYESACDDPRGVVNMVADFLGVRPTPAVVNGFSTLISVPPSSREPSAEADRFDARDLAEVEAFGFQV